MRTLYLLYATALVPYFGLVGGYRLVVSLFFILILILLGSRLLCTRPTMHTDVFRLLAILYCILCLSMLSGLIGFMLGRIVESDLAEYLRLPMFIGAFLITGLSIKASELADSQSVILGILKVIFGLALAGTLVSLAGMLIPETGSFVEAFGEAEVYDSGYAQYRAFGIIGQPGKQACFLAMLVVFAVTAIDIELDRSARRWAAGIIIMSLIGQVLTFSRTGIIFSFALLVVLIFRKKLVGLALLLVGSLGVAFGLAGDSDVVEQLFRGIDLLSGQADTLGHRNVLKVWAADKLSENLLALLVGFGPAKEWLGQFNHPYAVDLTLRNPDSSVTVWFLHYGLLGIISYLVLFLTILHFVGRRLRNGANNVVTDYLLRVAFSLTLLLGMYALLDPPFHEPKIMVMYWATLGVALSAPKGGDLVQLAGAANRSLKRKSQ